jgi:CHAT domain-containing protein
VDTPGTRAQNEGLDAFAARRFDEAERAWIVALAEFEREGNLVDQAHVLRNLSFLPRLSVEQRIALAGRALEVAAASGDGHVTGLVRHHLSDLVFIQGDYAGAFTHVEAAIALLDAPPVDARSLARALTSRGKLLRALGQAERGFADQIRAATLLEGIEDWAGASQAHHGRALGLRSMGRYADAIAAFELAVTRARQSDSQDRLAGALAQTAGTYADAGAPSKGVPLLQEAERLRGSLQPSVQAILDTEWAEVLTALDRFEEALARVDESASRTDTAENVLVGAWRKADLLMRLGRRTEGLAAYAQATERAETSWRRLVPSDAAKRGFARQHSIPMGRYVEYLSADGRHADALEAAERAKGRAFLDLLASVDSLPLMLAPAIPVVEITESHGEIPWVPVAARATRPERVEALLTMRGGAPPTVRAPAPEPDITAVAVADAPRLSTVVAQAARLRSHLLCFWVSDSTVLIWVVAPDGTITHREVTLTREALTALVQAALPAPDTTTRGTLDDRLTITGEADRANRQLYRHLIAPVAALLPADGRGLVTIVPHGPLHRLSFAALRAPTGAYFIEQTAIHYSSSASALAFTGTRRGDGDGGPLVVADPRTADETLAALPGAVEEGRAVARALGVDRTTVLRGASATEQSFRGAAADASIVHIAAHGVVKDDDAFGSFIALAGGGPLAVADGRLTGAEMYGLRVKANLVVLSGCRTAVGPVTGDGMLGLTRGVFAAGAPSVVASLWDVSDTVTASLFSRFYSEWPARTSKAEALRRAQLRLIADLRAGRIRVDTPAGRFTLPEHPSLWAGLALYGEP